jgi:phosphate transport system substrate-binding protein
MTPVGFLPTSGAIGRGFRLTLALVLMTFVAALVVASGARPAAAGGPAISGVGSSYAALAIIQWDAEVSSEYGDSVNYSTQSSVIGLNDFAQYPQVDFGASEIGYSTNQADQTPPASFSYQYLPDIAGAECLDYNLSSTTGTQIRNLKLDSTVMAGIFSGTITYWDDPAITSLNPGVLLPHNPIIVVFRSDPSGDNYIFSDYLETTQPAAWNAFTAATANPSGAQAIWPQSPSGERQVGEYNFGNWTSENGSDTASGYVYGNPNSITYVETGYALLHNDPCASVENASGAYVAPSETADAIALQNDVLQPDLEQDLTPVFDSPQAGAYSVSAYSYLLMAEQSEIPAAKQPVEAQYVQFLACDGQKAAGVLGYSPLPPNLVQADFDAVQRITGTALPAPTAANCGDPYITGSFNAGGQAGSGPTITGSTNPTASTGATAGTSGGAAASPVASTSATAAATGKSSAPGGGSESSGTGSTSGKDSSSASPAAKAAAVAAAAAAKRKAAEAVHAAPGQIPGEAMTKYSSEFLGLPGPSLVVVVSTLAFLAVLAVPPLVFFSRRRRNAGRDSGGPRA